MFHATLRVISLIQARPSLLVTGDLMAIELSRIRGLLCVHDNDHMNLWEVLPIAGSEANKFAIVHVFCRKGLSSVFPTSSAVILANCDGIKRKRIQDRLSCLLCPGRAGKRMMCTH